MLIGLQEWYERVEKERESFSTRIFSCVENSDMSKLEAVILLSKYELLPILSWIEIPKFAEDYDYFDKYSTINYADLLCEEDFTGKWTRYRNATLEEAIDQVWDIVKDKKIIGCVYDW